MSSPCDPHFWNYLGLVEPSGLIVARWRNATEKYPEAEALLRKLPHINDDCYRIPRAATLAVLQRIVRRWHIGDAVTRNICLSELRDESLKTMPDAWQWYFEVKRPLEAQILLAVHPEVIDWPQTPPP